MSNTTLEALILELSPFSGGLKKWLNRHPEALRALKNVYPEKFISPGMIITSYPSTGDEVLGVYTYHHGLKNPIFKQDFIVNIGNKGEDFILYARNPEGSSKYVKDINDFFALYGKYGYTRDIHHITLEQLPSQLQERAKEAVELARKMQIGTAQKITQAKIDQIYKEVMAVKEADRIVKQKLQS